MELFVTMNDQLDADHVVQRPADKYGTASNLRNENVAASAWEPICWNIANWNRVD